VIIPRFSLVLDVSVFLRAFEGRQVFENNVATLLLICILVVLWIWICS
jgi:hypothetical protein